MHIRARARTQTHTYTRETNPGTYKQGARKKEFAISGNYYIKNKTYAAKAFQ